MSKQTEASKEFKEQHGPMTFDGLTSLLRDSGAEPGPNWYLVKADPSGLPFIAGRISNCEANSIRVQAAEARADKAEADLRALREKS